MNQRSFADEIAGTGIIFQPTGFHFSPYHKSLLGYSIALRFFLVCYILVHVAIIGVSAGGLWFLERFLANDYQSFADLDRWAFTLTDLGRKLSTVALGVMALCIIFYCLFVHRAAANLERASAKGLTTTAGWAVGWSFIPFVNLFKIYRVMREIWEASHNPLTGRGGGTSLLALWWISYISSNVITAAAARMSDAAAFRVPPDYRALRTLTWIEGGASLLGAISGIALIVIVGGITRAQATWKKRLASQVA